MKKYRLWIALGLLILPVLARAAWFYQGAYARSKPVAIPNYAGLALPAPPLSTPQSEIAAPPAPGQVVLLDQTHDNRFTVTEMEALTKQIIGRGARLELVLPSLYRSETVLADRLKYASAYVVASPLTQFTLDEVQQVQRFVGRGGRVLVFTDAGRTGWLDTLSTDVVPANDLLAPFDLAFSEDYLYNLVENDGNYRNVLLRRFADISITQGLETIAFYAGRSVSTSSGTPLAWGDEHTLSSLTDTGGALAAAALSADGRVLAVGDLTFLTPPYHQVADNALFISRLAEFALGGERARDLTDFPFIFSRPLAVLPTQKVKLSADMLGALSKIQAPLKLINVTLSVVEKPRQDSDLAVLGLYTTTNDLAPYLEPFGLELPNSTGKPNNAFVHVPGLGKLSRTSTGVLLFSRTDSRATLTLLADTPEMLIKLINLLASGDLSPCIIQSDIGVCRLGEGAAQDADEGVVVSVEPITQTVAVGEMVTVNIQIKEVSNLDGAEFHLSFDPSVLEVVDANADQPGIQIRNGNMLYADLLPLNQADNERGSIDFAVLQLGRTGASGDGTLAVIEFKAKAAGVSPIKFRSTSMTETGVNLVNSDGKAIQCVAKPGSVTVSGETIIPTLAPLPTAVPATP